MHYEFLSKIMQSGSNYWCVSKMDRVNNCGRDERLGDQIILIAIPYTITLNIPADQVKFVDLEKLGRVDVDNIFLNVDYPPFQYNVTLYDVYDGFPLDQGCIRDFLKQALSLKSDQPGIYAYKELYKQIVEDSKPL